LRVIRRSGSTVVTRFEAPARRENPRRRSAGALVDLTASWDRLSEFGDQPEAFEMSHTLG
jgi:hypothetical protein